MGSKGTYYTRVLLQIPVSGVFPFCLVPLWLDCFHKSSVNLHCNIWHVNVSGWFLTSKPQARKEVFSKMKI